MTLTLATKPAPDEADQLAYIPLSRLILSSLNARQTVDPEEIVAMSDSIAATGLLQNLIGLQPTETDPVEIVAGGKRLRALQLLAKHGFMPRADSGLDLNRIPVRITTSEAQALEMAGAENAARIRSALTVTPAPDVVEIDLRAVSMEEIEKAAGQSPWVPPEYTMNEIVSDCCSFLREPRESAPDAGKVQALVDALEFYADRDNYEPVYERMPCDCCTDIYEPVKRDEGDTARAALAAWKDAPK